MSRSRLCPLPGDPTWMGLKHTGKVSSYTHADTWYPAWGQDDTIYSAYADGNVHGERVLNTWSHGVDNFYANLGEGNATDDNPDLLVTSGQALIHGSDIHNLTVEVLPKRSIPSPRFHGLYPCANMHLDGVWYQGNYYVHRWLDPNGRPITYELGPFRGWDISRDGGKTWELCERDDLDPLFGERGRCAGDAPIRFGAPHVVDHGKNQEHAPDGYQYLVAHGTQFPDGVANWCSGDAIFLIRFRPTPDTINKSEIYEFFAGYTDGNEPIWSSVPTDAKPIMEWPWRCGSVTATWIPAWQRYVALICCGPTDGGVGTVDYWVAAADTLTGPWHQVDYLEAFGSQGYFTTVPSCYLDANKPDILTLCWSANWDGPSWSSPEGSGYALCVSEFTLSTKKQDKEVKGPRPSWQ